MPVMPLEVAKSRLKRLALSFPFMVGLQVTEALKREYYDLASLPSKELVAAYVRSRKSQCHSGLGTPATTIGKRNACHYDVLAIATGHFELFKLIVIGGCMPTSRFSILGDTEHDEHPMLYIQECYSTIQDLEAAGFIACARIMRDSIDEITGRGISGVPSLPLDDDDTTIPHCPKRTCM
jgi:hypothetical protein